MHLNGFLQNGIHELKKYNKLSEQPQENLQRLNSTIENLEYCM